MPNQPYQVSAGRFFGDNPPSGASAGSVWCNGAGVERVLLENGTWANPPIGYATGSGSGSTVTQQTNRTTGVTLNALCGQITTNNASLAAGAEAEFTVTNNKVAATDVVVISCASGQTASTSVPIVSAVAAGSFNITLTNLNASTADTGAMVINFAVVKAATN